MRPLDLIRDGSVWFFNGHGHEKKSN